MDDPAWCLRNFKLFAKNQELGLCVIVCASVFGVWPTVRADRIGSVGWDAKERAFFAGMAQRKALSLGLEVGTTGDVHEAGLLLSGATRMSGQAARGASGPVAR